MDADHRPNPVVSAERTDSSMSNAVSTSRETRKGITPVVIACRLWYVRFSLVFFIKPFIDIILTNFRLPFTLCVLLSRARKIRCDSTRPECNNCLRRNNECEYDAMPKRRGPDKRPGTRQRRCKKRGPDDPTPPNPKRRKTAPEPPNIELEAQQHRINMADSKRTSPSTRRPERPADLHIETTTLHTSPNLRRPSSDSDHIVKVRPLHWSLCNDSAHSCGSRRKNHRHIAVFHLMHTGRTPSQQRHFHVQPT